jgi:Ser-tRNA(Ala) deacylase AlaX
LEIKELVKDVEKTELIYWRDSYARSFESVVLRSAPDGKKKIYIVLRSSAYHPKAGGQPSDTGFMTTSSGMSVDIKKVMISNGVIVHYGAVIEGNPEQLKLGEKMKCEINWEQRYSAMRKHTAGHLFDHALDVATGRPSKTIDSWLGDPCYVTYAGQMPNHDEIGKAVRFELEGIKKGLPVHVDFMSYQDMLRIAGDAPNIARLPESDLMRIVTIEGCRPIPCGGTHVKNTKEIGGFELIRVEGLDQGKAFRVYYDVR